LIYQIGLINSADLLEIAFDRFVKVPAVMDYYFLFEILVLNIIVFWVGNVLLQSELVF